jgi:CBS domain containing-hemolysin-like protein
MLLVNFLNFLKKGLTMANNTIDKYTSEKNLLDYKENLLRNFLQNIEAGDVMVQRSEFQAINIGDSLENILKKIENCNQEIIPVFVDNIDDVQGCVRVEDIYKKLYRMYNISYVKGKKPVVKLGENHLKSITLNVIIVSPLMPLVNLLESMQFDKIGMAVVADEFGGTQGFITNSTIINYLAKECNNNTIKIKTNAEGKMRIDAKMDLEDFEEFLVNYLKTKKLDKKDAEIIKHIENNIEAKTVGGFICSFTGHIPTINSSIIIGEIVFDIISATPRKINTVELKIKDF